MKKIAAKKIPWLTIVILSLLLTDFFIFKFYINSSESTQEIFSDFGAPYAIQIYQGQYWGILINRFLHINPIFLSLNIFFLLFFGFKIEKQIGWWRFLLLFLFSATFNSMIQLTFSNDAGIGFTSINFFFFFYLYGKSFIDKANSFRYKHILMIIALLVISVLLILNNQYDMLFGTEGIFAGLITGIILGISSQRKEFQIPFILLFFSFGLTTLFYAPWSAEWNYSKGYDFHLKNDYKHAQLFYKKALEINPNHRISRENIRIILIEELKGKALEAHVNEDYIHARKLYNEILVIDPQNVWAKENLSKLP